MGNDGDYDYDDDDNYDTLSYMILLVAIPRLRYFPPHYISKLFKCYKFTNHASPLSLLQL